MATASTVRSIRSYRRVTESLLLVMVLIALWQFTTGLAHQLYFPTPLKIWQALASGWISWKALETNVLPSFVRVALGWALAGVVGVTFGVLVGLFRSAEGFLDPLIHFGRAIPPPSVLPIFLIFFGIGDTMKILFIAFGVVWPVILNTVKGVRSIDPTILESATVYQIRGHRRLLHILLRAASPEIFAGLRISLALGFVLMVISEMISASGGIGFEILQSQASFDVVNMWAGMVVLGLGGILFSFIFGFAETRVLKWQRGVSGQQS